MVRSALGKVAWVGRTASMVFGLALVLALVFGVASMALGANGQNFILGVLTNRATAVTKLTGNVSGKPALQVVNPNTGAGSHALQLVTATGKPPLVVNASAGKAVNLNADKLDGMDSAQFVHGNGKIHRYGPVVMSGGAPIQELVVVGPFLIRAACDNHQFNENTITQLMVDESARPYSAAMQRNNTGAYSIRNTTDDRVDLMRDIGTSVMNTATGWVVSLEGEDRQITFNLYQHRSTDPTSGAVSCTFGGYVEE